jgi:membrane associated rhomboid family serine protease
MFFPLRDNVRSERAPIVNWALLVVNVAVFVYMLRYLPDAPSQQAFVEQYGLVPAQVRHGLAHPSLLISVPGPFLRSTVMPFFTSMFLHGGWAHLLGNLWFLLIFGDNVEGRMGPRRYFVFYFLCGIIAAALHLASVPARGVDEHGVFGRNATLDTPMIGASGAIAGVLGAYVVMFPRARVLTYFPPIFFFEVSAFLFLGVWFVIQFLQARGSDPPGNAVAVAYWAHVGGFLAGALLALCAPKRERPARRYAETF